jgi:hypothetical protein
VATATTNAATARLTGVLDDASHVFVVVHVSVQLGTLQEVPHPDVLIFQSLGSLWTRPPTEPLLHCRPADPKLCRDATPRVSLCAGFRYYVGCYALGRIFHQGCRLTHRHALCLTAEHPDGEANCGIC